MGSTKTLSKKIKLIKAHKTAKSAPRWADLKKFGMARARYRSIKRFISRHWRRDKLKV